MDTKHLFSVNVTEDKYNSDFDDTPFTTARLSPETRKRSKEAAEVSTKLLLKSTKMPLLILGYVLIGLGLIVITAFIEALPDAGLSTALRNAWWILLIGVILALAGGGILLYHKKAVNRDREESPEEAAANRSLENISQIVEMELGIPAEDQLTEVEVLPFEYKAAADGTVKESLQDGCYSNTVLYFWREEDTLCLTDYDCVMRLPTEALEGYVTVQGKHKISFWYKDEDCDKEPYAAYGIKEDKDYNYRMSTYYRVLIRHGDGRFEMRIPCYDFPAFQGLVEVACLDGATHGAIMSE